MSVDEARLRRFLETIGRMTRTPGTLYLTGGATALLGRWRDSTADLDFTATPDLLLDEILRAASTMDRADRLAFEVVSPADFIGEVPGWADRSIHVGRYGAIDVRHYDPVSQVLAKCNRWIHFDAADCHALIDRGWAEPAAIERGLAVITPRLYRHPTADVDRIRRHLALLIGPPRD